MNHLATTLNMTPTQIAGYVGVTKRTVRRWIAGVHKPNATNRGKLRQLVAGKHTEYNARDTGWKAAKDAAFIRLRTALMTPTELAEAEAERQEMRDWYAARNIKF